MTILKKNYIFYIYSNVSTLIENFLFRHSSTIDKNSNFHKKGFQLFKLRNKINFSIEKNKCHEINPYLKKILLESKQIKDIIKDIFIDNNFAQEITSLTGFNYNIDHITAYETLNIPKNISKNSWYSNHWHKDGPYSKNNIKLIIPLNDIDDDSGGIEVISSNISSKYSPALGVKKEFKPDLVFKSKALKNILIFCPHLCLHKAGNPAPSKTRKQLMFQINPSLKWTVSNNLYNNQKMIEPKFPLLYNLFSRNNKKTQLTKF